MLVVELAGCDRFMTYMLVARELFACRCVCLCVFSCVCLCACLCLSVSCVYVYVWVLCLCLFLSVFTCVCARAVRAFVRACVRVPCSGTPRCYRRRRAAFNDGSRPWAARLCSSSRPSG